LKRGKGNNWLLVKKSDEWASDADVTAADRSVVSGRDLNDVGGRPSGVEASVAQTSCRRQREGGRSSNRSEIGGPRHGQADARHAGRRTVRPFGWLFEVKWDGYRAVAEVRKGQVSLYSRITSRLNESFAPIAQSLAAWSRRRARRRSRLPMIAAVAVPTVAELSEDR